jgi:hypothetical protein
MNNHDEPFSDEPSCALDRAIRAAMAEPVTEEIKGRVIRTALGFAGCEPVASRNRFRERMTNMIRTHRRLSGAAAVAVATLAAGLALSISLAPPSARAYALEETTQANDRVTSYHVKITPGAAELGEAWVQLNPDGTPMQARMDFLSLSDGAKVVILSKGKAQVWFKRKNSLLLVHAEDALKRIAEMRDLADPRLAFERVQADKAAGKVQVDINQPAKDGEPIVLTVTSKINPDQWQVYLVEPRAKLVEQVTYYRRTGGRWEQVAQRHYLDYNKPIDAKVFQPEIPRDVMVLDWINRKPGLVKGDLTEDEIAKKVVRELFEALIAGDYNKAGLICEGVPGEKMKERCGHFKYLRIIEIGRPAPAPNPLLEALRVPVKVEIEIEGRRQVKTFSPFVRPPAGLPDRRVITGGF